MARYKLILAYEGTAFSGSQRQARGRTVQAELERALQLLRSGAGTTRIAGRTDAGVHAIGQVAAVDLHWNHSPEALRDAINAQLPRDLAVGAVQTVGDRFHPRFDARSRRYCYHVSCHPVRDPLRDRMAWRVWPAPDEMILRRLARAFVGRHDFGAFGSAPRRGGETVRTVTLSQWSRRDDEWCYEIAADGFLYRMVRRLVFVQVAGAQGKCSQEAVVHALNSGRPGADVPTGLAPAHGLVLLSVDY